jgi:hypothetical protein
MKLSLARTLAVAMVAAILGVLSCAVQTGAQPAQNGTPQSQQQSPNPSGKVIFSRSSDENGQTVTHVGPAAAMPTVQMATEPSADDAERQAVTFTNLDLDVRLHTAAQQIAVRALLTVRNDGRSPLAHIPLQISSSLNWEQVRVGGKDVSFPVATLNSDTDHTGQLHEAAVPLAQPLAPGKSLQLDLTYSGTVTLSARRLLTIGTPEDMALHSDWDEISVPFTGLRGFGNVVWYPVSSVPVILGDGDRLFTEIGRHKLRLTGAHFRMRLTVEFPSGQQPTIALVNGHPVNLSVINASMMDPGVPGIATASVDNVTLGFETPSLFVAIRKAHPGAHLTAWTLPDNEVAVQAWTAAAETVTPFLEDWLGQHPRSELTLLDLPDPDDAPYETGALLAASLAEEPADQLDRALVHALAHAFTQPVTQPPPAWLSEGVATFVDTLWTEKRHGREQALGMLEADRSALALAEPSSPGEGPGEPLATAISPIYYRTKAAYIFWMLRDLAGDAALSDLLRAESSKPLADADHVSAVTGDSIEKLLRKGGVSRDLSWFFADWVDADKGLPDLTIKSVFPNAEQGGTVLVAVNVANAGYATAEVPVTVRTTDSAVTERLLVPARSNAVQRILVMGKPTSVQVNDGTVPETQASVHITYLDEPSRDPASSSSSNPPQ